MTWFNTYKTLNFNVHFGICTTPVSHPHDNQIDLDMAT